MKVLYWDSLTAQQVDELLSDSNENGTALAIGGFDGPHRGHEALFSAVKTAATSYNLASGLVTFVQSPAALKKGHRYPGDVSTLKLRLSYFTEYGFDFVLLIDFSSEFSKIRGGVFFDVLVKTVRMRYLAVGKDFRCGYRLDTGVKEISQLAVQNDFRFESILPITFDGQRVSSSGVRSAIQSADFEYAEKLLGHPFLLDFNAPDWKRTSNVVDLESEVGSFTQLLPPAGNYSVVLNAASGKSVDAYMHITDSKVFLCSSNGRKSPLPSDLVTVQFRLS